MPPKNNQVSKRLAARKAPRPKTSSSGNRLVTAPQSRAVRATVPSGDRKQICVMTIKRPVGLTEWAQEYTLHPDNIPWLEGIAPSYQRWGLKGLKVWYEPRATALTPGTVSMAILSDFKDGTPKSLQSLTSVKGAVRGAPWDKFTLSCPKFRTYEYVSDVASLSGEDLNNRALGKIVVCADMDDSFTVGSIVGRIFIEYSDVLLDSIDPTLQRKSADTSPGT